MKARSESHLAPLLTVKELAAYLRVHPTTIYRLLRAGELPACRLGSDWRFSREAIDAWINHRPAIELSAGLHVQVNGRGERLDQSVGRGRDRVRKSRSDTQ